MHCNGTVPCILDYTDYTPIFLSTWLGTSAFGPSRTKFVVTDEEAFKNFEIYLTSFKQKNWS